jgi:hypothetical protein
MPTASSPGGGSVHFDSTTKSPDSLVAKHEGDLCDSLTRKRKRIGCPKSRPATPACPIIAGVLLRYFQSRESDDHAHDPDDYAHDSGDDTDNSHLVLFPKTDPRCKWSDGFEP